MKPKQLTCRVRPINVRYRYRYRPYPGEVTVHVSGDPRTGSPGQLSFMLRPYPHVNALTLASQSGAWTLYTYNGVPALLVLCIANVSPEMLLGQQAWLSVLIGEQSAELTGVCLELLKGWIPNEANPFIEQIVRFDDPTTFIHMLQGLVPPDALVAILAELRQAWDVELPDQLNRYAASVGEHVPDGIVDEEESLMELYDNFLPALKQFELDLLRTAHT